MIERKKYLSKKESQALHVLLLNRRIKQITLLPKWLFAEWFIGYTAFLPGNTGNSYSVMANDYNFDYTYAYDFFANFLTLWRNSSYGHPPIPWKIPPISAPNPSPPQNFHWSTVCVCWGEGGGMDIFWYHTLALIRPPSIFYHSQHVNVHIHALIVDLLLSLSKISPQKIMFN